MHQSMSTFTILWLLLDAELTHIIEVYAVLELLSTETFQHA